MLRRRHSLEDLAAKKWSMLLPPNFQFPWDDIWDSSRARKEAMLLWQVCYQAVVVNVWRGRISSHVDQSCSLCEEPKAETILHRFWSYPFSQQLWSFSIALLGYLGKLPADQLWPPPD
jgi:hypothetical protein